MIREATSKGGEMSKKGLFDDIPISDPKRDKAWAAFIRRKDVKTMMKHKEEFAFPIDGSYDLGLIVTGKQIGRAHV